MKRRITNGEEADVHTRWRHVITWTRGEVSSAKRRTRRRERREGQVEVRNQMRETETGH